MKKKQVAPLDLDKETIAKLDEAQLREIVGGTTDDDPDESCGITSCSGGTTKCQPQREIQ